MLSRSVPFLVFALTASTVPIVAAQPSPEAVVAAWQRTTGDAARAVRTVTLSETITQRVDGPRTAVTVETRGTLTYSGRRRPERVVREATVDGQPVPPARVAELGRRLGRGAGTDDATRPPHLLPPVLEHGVPVRLELDTVDGRAAWRVALRMPPGGPHRRRGPPPEDRAEAWFSRSASAPHLLRLRVEGERAGGAFVRTVDFRRTDGLDLPAAMSASAEVRQRRRLRVYATGVAAEARYGRATITR